MGGGVEAKGQGASSLEIMILKLRSKEGGI